MRLLIGVLLTLSTMVAADIHAVFSEFDAMARRDLWPGFHPESIPAAVYDGETTWLRNHPSPPAGFTAVADRSDLRVMPGLYELVRANSSVKIGDVLTATAMLKGESPKDAATLLIHESFHVYQRLHHAGWQANEATLFTYPAEDAAAASLAFLEYEALRRALEGDAACWATQFIEIRKERFAALPADAVAYERLTELNEGLAQYVQNRAGNREPDLSRNYGPAEIRLKIYATGPAIAAMLDRVAPEWKSRVETSLDALIPVAKSNACGFTGAERAGATERARKATAEVVSARVDSEKAFDAKPGWRVVVEADSHLLMPAGFDPVNVQRLTGGKVLHTRWLKLANDSGSAEAMGSRSVTTGAGVHPLFNGIQKWTVLLAAKPEGRDDNGVVEIEAPDFKLKFRQAKLEQSGEVLVVRLGGTKAR